MPGGGLPNLGPQNIVLPFVSHGWAVGVLFLVHILIVAFIMGTAWILVFTGSMPKAPRYERFERFTRTAARTLEITYSFGATFAVFAITVLIGLFPRYLSVMVSVLGVPLIVILAVWVAQVATLLLYYFTWETLRPRHRWWHQSLILLYSLAETTFIVMIALFTSYQITPPTTPTLAAAVSNPTWFPETLHRVAGNLSYAGFLIAFWGAWRYVRKRRTGTSVDKAFYHWVAHLGLLWGVGFELAQLPIGTYYVLAIRSAGPIGAQTYDKMMLSGTTSKEWLLQMLLLALMFVLAEVYMWASISHAVAQERGRRALQRMRQLAPGGPPVIGPQGDQPRQDEHAAELGRQLPDEAPRARGVDRFAEIWVRVGLWVLAAAGVLAILPAELPVFGSMTAKWVALGVFLVWTAVSLVLYVVVSRRWTWGSLPPVAAWSLLAAGVCISLLMLTMGVIRYTNPQTTVIEQQIPLPPVRVQAVLTAQR